MSTKYLKTKFLKIPNYFGRIHNLILQIKNNEAHLIVPVWFSNVSINIGIKAKDG